MGIVRVPVGLAIRNPNDAPVFVAETHALREDGSTSIIVSLNEPVFVPPHEMVLIPHTRYLSTRLQHQVRVIYLDGWGQERTREQAVTDLGDGRSQHWSSVAADEHCATTPAPTLMPLVLTTEPSRPVVACRRGCSREVAIDMHNPNANHRVRITEVWIDNPDGSTTAPARNSSDLHYVDAGVTTRLAYRITLDRVGQHTLRVTYVDGWARQHTAQTLIRVFLGE